MRPAPRPIETPPAPRAGENVRLRPLNATVLVLLTLALQAALPVYAPAARKLDLPLLAVVYLAVARRNVVVGLLIGAVVGLAQDSLGDQPLGVFGIIKTLVGYASASVSLYIEIDYPGARVVLTALAFLVHQALFWLIEGGLLDGATVVDPAAALMLAAVHAGLALLTYRVYDKARVIR